MRNFEYAAVAQNRNTEIICQTNDFNTFIAFLQKYYELGYKVTDSITGKTLTTQNKFGYTKFNNRPKNWD